ncbi:MAG: Rieske (2Fe-2S) protein [Desulfurococcales archaeon]|nr:Rieske (2Fe-2S) protein [Desulfurococcales archaeon]
MEMVRFARVKVFAEGMGRVKIIRGVPVLVVKRGDEFKAYVAVCPHKWYVLCERAVKDGFIICPGHGEKFKVDTGEPTVGKAKSNLIELKTAIKDNDVYIEAPQRSILEELVKATT